LHAVLRTPFSDGYDHAAILGDFNKLLWWYQATFGMLPAHQRFKTGDRSTRQAELRLIHQVELLLFKGGSQAALKGEAF
jgi:hypothetical protein